MDEQRDPGNRVGENADEPVVIHEIGNRTYIVANVDPLDVDGTRTVAVGAVLIPVFHRTATARRAGAGSGQ